MHSQKQILLMIVLAALVMRGPINAVGPMAPVVRDVFDLPWEAFGVLAGIPTMAFGLCSLAVLPLVAGFGSRTFAVAALTGAALLPQLVFFIEQFKAGKERVRPLFPVGARSLSRNADSERFNRGPERLGSLCHQGGLS